jgi:hypothetical protein
MDKIITKKIRQKKIEEEWNVVIVVLTRENRSQINSFYDVDKEVKEEATIPTIATLLFFFLNISLSFSLASALYRVIKMSIGLSSGISSGRNLFF